MGLCISNLNVFNMLNIINVYLITIDITRNDRFSIDFKSYVKTNLKIPQSLLG